MENIIEQVPTCTSQNIHSSWCLITENIEYVKLCYQNTDVYISWSQHFNPIILKIDSSFLSDVTKQIEDYYSHPEDTNLLSTRRRPMNERVKNCDDYELKKMIFDNLKDLINSIESNQLIKGIEGHLELGDSTPIEEDKHSEALSQNLIISNINYQNPSFERPDEWKKSWSECRIHEQLLKRKKYQHLSKQEASYIRDILVNFPNERKSIQRLYKLSYSTSRRLSKKIIVNEPIENMTRHYSDTWNTLEKEEKKLIKDYLTPPCEPKCIAMIKKQLEVQSGKKYSSYWIKKFVKNEMRYSYKKGSSRPPRYLTKRIQLVKTLFWNELLSMISKGDVIINIDESSFDRSIRREYSWLPNGRSTPIVNDRTKGRAWLTLATWSTGEWLAMALSETMDSKRFCLFLKILELIISRHCHNFEKLPTVIIDKARTHSSRLTKKVIESLEFKIRFLAPYCPEVAPVERAFGLIK